MKERVTLAEDNLGRDDIGPVWLCPEGLPGATTYVRADIADRHKAQRDRLLEAALSTVNVKDPAEKSLRLTREAIAECEGGEG